MPRTLPSSSSNPCAPSSLINRRVSIRHPSSNDADATIGRRRRSPFQKVRIHDVSEGGIALVLKQPPPIGKCLFLQLTNRILEFSFDMAAEVRHVTPLKSGWIVGLQFDQPMTPEELAGLL